jgi:hypothetical protein
LDNDDDWFDGLSDEPEYLLKGIFKLRGEYEKRTIFYHECFDHIPVIKANSIHVHSGRSTKDNGIDYVALRPKFGWLPADSIAKVQKVTERLFLVQDGSNANAIFAITKP